jgi:hypothetical protein
MFEGHEEAEAVGATWKHCVEDRRQKVLEQMSLLGYPRGCYPRHCHRSMDCSRR